MGGRERIAGLLGDGQGLAGGDEFGADVAGEVLGRGDQAEVGPGAHDEVTGHLKTMSAPLH